MSRIALKKKIAQMLMVGFDGYDIKDNHQITEAIGRYHLGGVILYDLEEINYKLKNIKSPKQVQKLVENLQNLSDEELLVGIDHEGGQVIRLKEEYGFPKTFSHQHLGTLNDPSLTYEKSAEMAGTSSALGFNLNFAPVVDLSLNPDNPIIGKRERSFSGDPQVVTSHARQFVKAHKDAGIISCIKHFPGHGSSSGDSHLGFVDVTETWSEIELAPYKKLITEEQVDCVMTAHVFNKNIDPDYPATLSRVFISKILRKEIGFDGVVISDDLNMGAIKDNYDLEQSLRLAINAGVDILLVSYNEDYKEELCVNLISIIKSLVEKGSVSEERINESYSRVRTLKNKLERTA
ncbi:MAG: glycoside hydrolase family 3 [Candidatus Dadabacteria bacterium]|nr:glycoside hydrolase family 3 [Candidatus Dadabacteria bacterium]NIS10225.1 glycoside hydrolase family 3 [Candidatus Dadabacteria bacterium]NIV42670.1 glycoside hydrolase family 3 [Candidatus Dadabacteria bacterium]NIX16593.1 glycoside hydrolase family 3 [Candidatus Dadabacteria bacterium]NIY23140.1 glycoside hydrolase family 3 [Candidatus Dadabacteria bacterium]